MSQEQPHSGIGEQLSSALDALPFRAITVAAGKANAAEHGLHQAGAGTHDAHTLLNEAQECTQRAITRLAGVSSLLPDGKSRIEAYAAATGVGDMLAMDEKASSYTEATLGLASLTDIRKLTESAMSQAQDVMAWTQRTEEQYPASIPPPEIMGELGSIAGFYGISALDETCPDEPPGV